MIPLLNTLEVACAVIGNHEFDFGPSTLEKYVVIYFRRAPYLICWQLFTLLRLVVVSVVQMLILFV